MHHILSSTLRSAFPFGVLALALALSTAFAPAPDRGDDEAAVRAVVARLFDAFNAHDAEAHAAVYADGAQIFWGEGEVITLDDRAAFIEMGRRWHAQAAAMRLDAGPATIRFLDDDTATALVEGTMFMGEAPVGQMHTLLVLQKTPSGWRIAAEHDAQRTATEG